MEQLFIHKPKSSPFILYFLSLLTIGVASLSLNDLRHKQLIWVWFFVDFVDLWLWRDHGEIEKGFEETTARPRRLVTRWVCGSVAIGSSMMVLLVCGFVGFGWVQSWGFCGWGGGRESNCNCGEIGRRKKGGHWRRQKREKEGKGRGK